MVKLYFLRTCMASPEQYDVYTKNGEQVAYVRLRYGNLRVDYPSCGGDTIYADSFEDSFKGCFDDEERDHYLCEIVEAIKPKLYLFKEDVTYEIVDDISKLTGEVYGN